MGRLLAPLGAVIRAHSDGESPDPVRQRLASQLYLRADFGGRSWSRTRQGAGLVTGVVGEGPEGAAIWFRGTQTPMGCLRQGPRFGPPRL